MNRTNASVHLNNDAKNSLLAQINPHPVASTSDTLPGMKALPTKIINNHPGKEFKVKQGLVRQISPTILQIFCRATGVVCHL